VVTGKLGLVTTLNASQWTWVIVTGIVLAGYVGTWFSALARAPATVVASVLVLAAPITAILDSLFRGTVPAGAALAGYVLIAGAAGALLVEAARRSRRMATTAAPV
jgi:drug/metabolite transporter (DMT)-like permease